MPFSHHSHSGQFCGHAKDKLEDVVQAAIAKKMEMYALTEHMPREDQDLYPEENDMGVTSESLHSLFDDYYHEAKRLQAKYDAQIKLLVGMEVDWIRPSSEEAIQGLLDKYQLDLYVGSVHHVHGVPIDYSREQYLRARGVADGVDEDEKLFSDYFDLQFEMLKTLKPPIVGHFDVIRLLCNEPNGSFKRWRGVWEKIVRNLDFVAHYGGVLEINSAALRKGMSEPYPKAEICEAFMAKGGTFVLSDDSHGVAQIGTHYEEALDFLKHTGIKALVVFEKNDMKQSAGVNSRAIDVAAMVEHEYFAQG